MPEIRQLEGNLVVPKGARFGLVATRFNDFFVSHLVNGAVDAIVRHGGQAENISVARVPGAWELPVALLRLAQSGRFDALVALGVVVRGSTPHFDYVAGEAAKGAAQVSMQTGVPVAFGVLTTDTLEQAIERSGTKAGNKGFEAALAAIEMVSLFTQLEPENGGGQVVSLSKMSKTKRER